MTTLKLTSWNAEWLEHTAGVDLGWYAPNTKIFPKTTPSKKAAKEAIAGLKSVITQIGPDILFLCEGVKGSAHMGDFVQKHLPDYDLVVRPGNDDKDYGVQGLQWLWFLVNKRVSDKCSPRLLDNATWQAFTAAESKMGHQNGSWMVSAPKVKSGVLQPNVRSKHDHYRHPQVLVLDWKGTPVEVIGLHLKSKLVTKRPRKRKAAESFETYAKLKKVAAYLAGSHVARIKLSTEATDVRYYIDHRFAQDSEPSIFVLGDLNDGPGKELLEREYLFHDLIGNLQGEIFFANRFLNHALFDAPNDLRWTARFKDFLDPGRPDKILLDHILFTQALSGGGGGPLRVPAKSGRVEHAIYESVASLQPDGEPVSDHRPVSVSIKER